MTKALALISGGLDSILSAKIISDQGIDVLGICFKSAFFGPENAIRMAGEIGIPLKIIDFTNEHIEMIKNPKHGYGKNMNPCIDCHAMMLNFAGKIMEEMGADFLVTGEVLNQRPMSQTIQSLNIVKNESGYGKKILRPLCALNLPPTEMEIKGLVDREKLLDIKGKSRKVQMELAKKLGINDYPSPAGGCSLTEPGFSKRLRDLYTYKKEMDLNDIELLKIGRHFRLSPESKAISTRSAAELPAIKGLLKEDDMIFEAAEYNGSIAVLRGTPSDSDFEIAARLAARYSKGGANEAVLVRYGAWGAKEKKTVWVKPADDSVIESFML